MEERYTLGTEIGEGAFGRVFLAIEKRTGRKRAIKRIKDSLYTSWSEAEVSREVQALIQIGYHPNIVSLLEVHRQTDNSVDLVFAYIPDGSLADLFHHRRRNRLGPPPADVARQMLSQILRALDFVHRSGWIHRDVKPDNLLLRGDHCKLADFSLARPDWSSSLSSSPTNLQQEHDSMTTYVSTRWYRAPEIILAAPDYTTPIDIFATGCIAAEFVQLVPLFPGRDQFDQLCRILSMLGTPRQVRWPKGQALMERLNLDDAMIGPSTDQDNIQQQHLQHPRARLADWLLQPTKHTLFDQPPLQDRSPTTADDSPHCFIDLVFALLTLDPDRRCTAEQALQHSYFVSSTNDSCHDLREQQDQQQKQQQWQQDASPTLSTTWNHPIITTTPPPNYHNNGDKENDAKTKVAVTVSASYKHKDAVAPTMTMTSPPPLCEDNHHHHHFLSGNHNRQPQQSSPDNDYDDDASLPVVTKVPPRQEPPKHTPTKRAALLVNPYQKSNPNNKQTTTMTPTPASAASAVKNPYAESTKLRLTRVPGK